jgi:hypothetical protein
MRDRLLAGAAADVLILTSALIAELAGSGHVVADSAADIGVVRTAIAVRSSDANPAVGDADSLRAALLAADAVYFPDPNRHPFRQGARSARHRRWRGGSLRPILMARPPCADGGAQGHRSAAQGPRSSTPGVRLVAPLPKSSSWRPPTPPLLQPARHWQARRRGAAERSCDAAPARPCRVRADPVLTCRARPRQAQDWRNKTDGAKRPT